MLPCGTPEETGLDDEIDPSTVTRCCRPYTVDMKQTNQAEIFGCCSAEASSIIMRD